MTETCTRIEKEIVDKENAAVNYIKEMNEDTKEHRKEMTVMLERDKAMYAATVLRNKTILANLKW